MQVAFTGARSGMTPAQKLAVERLLAELQPSEVAHGDCVGADYDFAEIANGLGNRPRILAFPGFSAATGDDSQRGRSPYSDETRPAKTYFARNRDLVTWCDVLIATPFDKPLSPSGGTAYTANYGRGRKPVAVVWPTGEVEYLDDLRPEVTK